MKREVPAGAMVIAIHRSADIVFTMVFVMPAMNTALRDALQMEMGGQPGGQAVEAAVQGGMIGGMAGALCGGGIALIYPIAVIVVMMLPSVRQAFSGRRQPRWRDEGQDDFERERY
jgi:hypothetical protein